MPSLKKRKVIAVTGSPNPYRLVAPAASVPSISRRYGGLPPLRDWKKDKEFVEEMRHESEDISDHLMMERRIPLADFECRHGKLPDDYNIECDCWLWEFDRLVTDLIPRVVRSASGQVRAALSGVVYGDEL